MAIIATGIELAKNVFAVHGVNLGGRCSFASPRSVEPTLGALIAALPPTVIGMAACSGAHFWARGWRQLPWPVASAWLRHCASVISVRAMLKLSSGTQRHPAAPGR